MAAAVMALSLGSSARAEEGTLGLSCGHDSSQVFLRFLDPLYYTLVPNGGFESGASGWKLSGGATVVSGNEPWYLSGAGSRALYLPAGSSATSPAMCVELTFPVVRFVSKGGGLFQYVRVEALWRDSNGRQQSIDLLPGALPTGSYWAPTLPLLQLGGAIDALSLDGLTTQMQFRFTPTGFWGGGNWRIDDVFVDPWKRV